MFRKTIKSVQRRVGALIFGPDRYGVQAASLSIATSTFAPQSAGVRRGFTGLPGYGVYRWGGRATIPVQNFPALVGPVAKPTSQRLGFGAGVAGQPGLPNTGDQTADTGFSLLGRTAGLGG